MPVDEIVEGNKIIAVFDGKKVITENEEGWDVDNPRLNVWYENSLQYHSSWDWLMPIVEKIESLIEPNTFSFDICENHACVYNGAGIKQIVRTADGRLTKIQSVWDCVIRFIKYYNDNTLNSINQ